MVSILSIFQKTLGKPKDTQNTSDYLVWFLWILRVFIFFQAFYQIFFGEKGFGVITLICFFIITLPKYFTGGKVIRFPVEIELILFLIVLIQYIIGEEKNLYRSTPYFDKFVHLTIPFLIAVISYCVFFTMYSIGRLKTGIFNVFLLVVFLTLGIGAMWEIIEYGRDSILLPIFHFKYNWQGNATESPFYDTMNDLVADLAGGILGAVFSVSFLLKNSKKGRSREFIKEISSQVFRRKFKK